MNAEARKPDDAATSPTRLCRIRAWDDAEAWVDFVGQFRATILRTCRGEDFGTEAAEEVFQRVLIRLATSMKSFCCDPSREDAPKARRRPVDEVEGTQRGCRGRGSVADWPAREARRRPGGISEVDLARLCV